MNTRALQENLLVKYFLLVLVLSVPFWLLGGSQLPLPMTLPVSSFMWINPAIAASILLYKQSGFNGLKELWKKALDYRKIKDKIWYLPILLITPLIYFLSYIVMRLAGLPLPGQIQVPLLMVPVFFLMFFIPSIFEELGWMGYAVDPLQNRWGALKTGIILGLVWQMWHIIPLIQANYAAGWIVWHFLEGVALRILIVWIYNNTGKSVFATILVHDMVNISWSLFPNYGSHYHPFVTGLITIITTGIVIFGWRSKTLARYRPASVSG